MKKNSVFIIICSILSSVLCLTLLIFCIPNQVPMHISFNETISSLCSKWILFIFPSLVILFTLLTILLKNATLKKFCASIFAIIVFETLLIFAYYSLETEFVVGSYFKIPISILIFLPIAFLLIVWSNLLKTIPYKSKFGIKTKYSLETEFLWTQIHVAAKDKFFAVSFILLLRSFVFSFFRHALVELVLFISIIIITYMLVYKDAKMMYNKYHEMKLRKDKLQKNKDKNKG